MDFSWTISSLNPLTADNKHLDLTSETSSDSTEVQPHHVKYQARYCDKGCVVGRCEAYGYFLIILLSTEILVDTHDKYCKPKHFKKP